MMLTLPIVFKMKIFQIRMIYLANFPHTTKNIMLNTRLPSFSDDSQWKVIVSASGIVLYGDNIFVPLQFVFFRKTGLFESWPSESLKALCMDSRVNQVKYCHWIDSCCFFYGTIRIGCKQNRKIITWCVLIVLQNPIMKKTNTKSDWFKKHFVAGTERTGGLNESSFLF